MRIRRILATIATFSGLVASGAVAYPAQAASPGTAVPVAPAASTSGFGSSITALSGASQAAPKLADSRADIVGFGNAGVYTALANGTGGFGSAQFPLAAFGAGSGAGSWEVAKHPRVLADINGDNHADIVGFGNAGVYTALANGTGGFGSAQFVSGAFGAGSGAGSWEVAKHPRFLADINGDNHADIVGFGNAGVYTALANGTGGFGSAQFVSGAFGAGSGAGSWEVAKHPRFLADINGDNRADIVGFGNAGVYTALANGTGGFGSAQFPLAAFGAGSGAGSWEVAKHPRFLADINGDNHADIVGFGNAGVYTALANGTGGFGSAQFPLAAFGAGSGAGSWEVAKHPRVLADINGDNHADIVGFGNAGVYTALANGTGGFGSAQFVSAAFGAGSGAGSWEVAKHPRVLADINGDNHADIVGFGNAGVYTALANGTGGFGSAQFVSAAFGAGSGAGSWEVAKHPRVLADIN